MIMRFLVAAGVMASAFALAGCEQEAKAPTPVRPVLSAVLQPAPSGSTAAVGTIQPRYEIKSRIPRSGTPHRASR